MYKIHFKFSSIHIKKLKEISEINFIFFNIYLLFWLLWILVVASELLVEARGI